MSWVMVLVFVYTGAASPVPVQTLLSFETAEKCTVALHDEVAQLQVQKSVTILSHACYDQFSKGR